MNRFVKRWYRGSNTCSRCDFEFMPLAGSRLALKRSEHSVKSTHGPRGTTRPASATVKSSDDKRTVNVKKEEKVFYHSFTVCKNNEQSTSGSRFFVVFFSILNVLWSTLYIISQYNSSELFSIKLNDVINVPLL